MADPTVNEPSVPDPMEAGLAASFGPDSGPPLPAGGSVLRALSVSLPSIPRVQLREPYTEAATPVHRPRSAEMPALPDLSGRLQLHGEIARGGMGAVLKARDTDLGRDVAVKVLLETHAGKTELVQRFIEEAQIAGQLQHPGVTPVYELGQFADQRPYFTMKLVKGKTLAALLAARKDPAEDRATHLDIYLKVCQTLAYAHARGVIHRDLKPANVMVGSFGEVQVMDWGLAKVLQEGGIADEKQAQLRQTVSVIQTQRSAGMPEVGSQTQVGSVLGTPAYMAPEQARGDLELVDARADVFGLGAILCEILTGQPPFTGKNAEAMRKSQTAQLQDAFGRLDSCGADPELVGLTRRCLAAEPWDRPRDASEVAAALTAYQSAVADRLRRAEVERAAAEARAEEEKNTRQMAEAKMAEERRRRRATLAAATALLVLILAGGGVAAWWWQDRTARVRDVEAALAEADAHEQAGRWPEMRAALERAEGRLGGGGPEQLKAKLQQARLDMDTVAELDAIRLEQTETAHLHEDRFNAEARYLTAFARYGITAPETAPEEAAARVRGSVIREALLAALDYWRWLKGQRPALGIQFANKDGTIQAIIPGGVAAVDGRLKMGDRLVGVGQGSDGPMVNIRGKSFGETRKLLAGLVGSVVRFQVLPAGASESRVYALTRGGDVGAWLVAVVDAADDHAWRRAVRQACVTRNRAELKRLVQQPGTLDQPPSMLTWLGTALEEAGLPQEEEALWRQAQRRYPGDFWINYELGTFLDLRARPAQPEEAVGYFRAAVAVRPAATNHFVLGLALQSVGDLDGATAAYRQAVALDSNYWPAYNNLGLVFLDKKQLNEAIGEFRRAVEAAPNNALVHVNLGLALATAKDWDEAIREERKAIRLNPNYALAHYNLGRYLSVRHQRAEAGQELRAAVRLDPQHATYHNELGYYLERAGQRDEAIGEYRRAIGLNPKFADAYFRLGYTLEDKQDHDAAADAYRKAIALDPKMVVAHVNLGSILYGKRDWDGAMTEYNQVIALNEKYPNIHLSLGNVLYARKDLNGALAEYRRAIELDPKNAVAHSNVGNVLRDKNDLDGAIAEYRQALALNRKDARVARTLAFILYERGRPAEAQASWKEALEQDPPQHDAWYGYAELCLFLGDEAEYRRTRRALLQRFGATTDPTIAERTGRACLLLPATGEELRTATGLADRAVSSGTGHNFYIFFLAAKGLAEYRLDHLQSAIERSQKAVDRGAAVPVARFILAMAQYRRGEVVQAQATLATAVRQYDWNRSTRGDHDLWIAVVLRREAELLIVPHLAAFFKGEYQPKDNEERLKLIEHCIFWKRYAAGERLYTDAFAADPKLAEDPDNPHRYNAACFAALAGSGQGSDAGNFDDKTRARLRRQALTWLRAELALLAKQAASNEPAERGVARQKLQGWQKDRDLAGIRDQDAVAKLPADERAVCQQLWADVAALLQKVGQEAK